MGFRIFSVKTVAASATVLSSAVAVHFATPAVTKFIAAEAPRLYESVSAWLTPPYLYFVINGIIISIAATSHFQKPIPASDHLPVDPALSARPDTVSPYANPDSSDYTCKLAEDGNSRHPEFLAPEINVDVAADSPVSSVEIDREIGFVISRASWSPRKTESNNEGFLEKLATAEGGGALKEKPPASTRPGRRRSTKASPEAGKPLGVSRSKKHETLESTWRTITEGRPVPLARHLKKSVTRETHARAATTDPLPSSPAILKSETFAAGSVAAADLGSPSFPSGEISPAKVKLRREPSAGKLRREPSLGQDDLNRRVEAFIKKFNEEMRLQRQNSVQQYLDMIKRSNQ
ncbi:hypothetical protein KSP39_PZI021369 [Platanthera zijinensis]|uniref:DUF4408 domain-containing protein n=1 Tax=Platanthera zijinensis TaxID=2320716 RepID=A0AAP0AXW6_9ASPA